MANQESARKAKGALELMSRLNIYSEPTDARRTHIICTIGTWQIARRDCCILGEAGWRWWGGYAVW